MKRGKRRSGSPCLENRKAGKVCKVPSKIEVKIFYPNFRIGRVFVLIFLRKLGSSISRVQVLEQQVQQLQSRSKGPKAKRSSGRVERATGPLPNSFVPLTAFVNLHKVAETKVQTHTEAGLLPVKYGEWTGTEGTMIIQALDAKGQKAFYQLYRDLPYFTRCSQCPHGYLDTV